MGSEGFNQAPETPLAIPPSREARVIAVGQLLSLLADSDDSFRRRQPSNAHTEPGNFVFLCYLCIKLMFLSFVVHGVNTVLLFSFILNIVSMLTSLLTGYYYYPQWNLH